MALPTVIRSWQFNVNNIMDSSTATTQARATLRAIKNMMSGTGGVGTWTDMTGSTITPTGSWIVSASSNSVTTSIGTDLWAADSNLVGNSAGSAHSWIVLQQTAISPTYQVLIDMQSTNHFQIVVRTSHTGFGVANGGTDGSITAAPTALNSNLLAGALVDWGSPNATTAPTRLHMMRSTDGKATRILLGRGGRLVGFWMFEQASSSISGWNTMGVARMATGDPLQIPTTETLTADILGGSALLFSGDVSGSFASRMTSEVNPSIGSQLVVQTQISANSLDLLYPMLPIGIYSVAANHVGRYGSIVDMWYGLVGLPTGITYPGSGSLRQFAQASIIIVPWNRSSPAWN